MKKKIITDMTNAQARAFFLRSGNYCSLDLPQYFNFQPILDAIACELNSWQLNVTCKNYSKGKANAISSRPEERDNVSYQLYSNKDGRYDWRPLQIINPFVYVSLVNLITEEQNWTIICRRLKEISKIQQIKCYSLPFDLEEGEAGKKDTISNWWREIEQQSIKMSMDFKYMLNTDITNCYGSLYTHSISWAIHGLKKSKKNINKLLGDKIDKMLRWSTYNQTNGIPQGSVLMDFIAELVLSYADELLSQKIKEYNKEHSSNKGLKIGEYKILRYRDDYRIFTHTQEDAARIAKILTSVLAFLNFKLNTQKTFISDKIIDSSIKPDKIYWNKAKNEQNSLQKHLLLIHNLSEEYPNSGSVIRALTEFFERIHPIKVLKEYDVDVLIAIAVDIAYHNPKTYPHIVAIVGKLLSIEFNDEKRINIINKILNKFKSIPNTEYLQLWIQRLTIVEKREMIYSSKLCQTVYDKKVSIWDYSWLHKTFQDIFTNNQIVDEETIVDLPASPSIEEVNVFAQKQYDM